MYIGGLQVAKHIRAIQQRAAVLGSGPAEWAIGAKCMGRLHAEDEWRKAVIIDVSLSGQYMIDWLPSAQESCFPVRFGN